jgi:DNA-binding IclR family transcriptional regulator
MRRNSFSQVVQPSLDELSRRCGATALGLRVFGLDHMVAVAISRPELPLRLHFEIGTRLPALIGATGRCLAAFGGYPWNELRRRFRALRWYRAPSLRQWRAEIDATRERGYSIDQGNYAQGVTILGVPVLDSRGLMSYSITTASVSEQMAESGVIALAEEMRSIAGTISQQLRA